MELMNKNIEDKGLSDKDQARLEELHGKYIMTEAYKQTEKELLADEEEDTLYKLQGKGQIGNGIQEIITDAVNKFVRTQNVSNLLKDYHAEITSRVREYLYNTMSQEDMTKKGLAEDIIKKSIQEFNSRVLPSINAQMGVIIQEGNAPIPRFIKRAMIEQIGILVGENPDILKSELSKRIPTLVRDQVANQIDLPIGELNNLIEEFVTPDNIRILSANIETPIKPRRESFDEKEEKSDSSTDIGPPLDPPPPMEGNGLYNTEIDKVLENDPDYIGCFPKDRIQLPKDKKKFSFIMNLDNADQKGSHWVATYVDPLKEKTIEFFDPFGTDPPKEWLETMKKYAKEYPFQMKLKINKVPNQKINSDMCGWHSIKFLIARNNGIPFKTITGFKEEDNSEYSEDVSEKLKSMFPYI